MSDNDWEQLVALEADWLRDLSPEALEDEMATRVLDLRIANERYWAGMCEQLVREVKAVWPNAHYLGLLADEGDGDPFWDIETVRDVTGGVLGSYEVENQKFAPFQAIWLLRYADRYEDRFTGDNVPYFDLVNREPLLVEEYEKSIGEVAF